MEENKSVCEPNQNLDINGRPEMLEGRTCRLKTPCGSFFLTLNENEGRLFETRLLIGKSGNCVRNLMETIGILLSLLLQSNVSRDIIARSLSKRMDIHCGNMSYCEGQAYHSCIDYTVKKILEELLSREEIKIEE